MYNVYLYPSGVLQGGILIHDSDPTFKTHKLPGGSVVDEDNSISSFSFEIYPNNPGYTLLVPRQTHIRVRDTRREKDIFVGRVLKISPEMQSDGLILKSVVCEDRRGYLLDSRQPYADQNHFEGDETRTGLEEFIDTVLENHNARTEAYKHVYRGNVTVHPFESSDSVFKGFNWQTTWDCLTEKLIGSFGGHLLLRESGGVLYLDYLAEVGSLSQTEITVGRNMISARQDIDPNDLITRLIPLGAKITELDNEGNEVETEQRITIEDVNDGKEYIDSEGYITEYGIVEGTQIWDDVTNAANLLRKGMEWLAAHNALVVSVDVSALDLSLIDLDADSFALYAQYRVINNEIGLNGIFQITKTTTNIIEPLQSSFVMGDVAMTLSDAMLDRDTAIRDMEANISSMDTTVKNNTESLYSYVESRASEFSATVDEMRATLSQQVEINTAWESFKTSVTNILSMEPDGTSMIFQQINEAISNVSGVESTHWNEILTHIRFSVDGIEIGKKGNAITMRLDNDDLSFYNNGVRVAYISDNKLFITDGQFLRSLQIGSHAFVLEDNGSVSFLYLGDDDE